MRYRQPRAACRYLTELAHAGTRRGAVIRDVTSVGACAEIGASELRPGDSVRIWVQGRPVLAEVRWNRAAEVGLRFARPLDPREMAVVRHQVRIAPVAGRARRGVHGFAEL